MSEELKEVEDLLKERGFDGLYHPGECACEIGDLAPCGECERDYVDGNYINGCEGGYKHFDPRPGHSGDWCMSGHKDGSKIDWDEVTY